MNKLRALLENVWICKDSQKDLYYQIKHELPQFQRFIRELVGWRVINTEHLLKLEKIPAHAESFMGIQEFSEPLDYCFLCVVLMFLEDKEEQEQFLLSELIDYVEIRLKGLVEIDWTSFSQRKSLVRTLQYIEKNEMLRVYEGESEGFGQEYGSEVLYENTGYSKYFAVAFSRSIAHVKTPEDFENLQMEEIDTERGRTRINRVYRQLIACPMMYWESVEEADSLYLRNQRNWVEKYLSENIGGRLDIHKNAAFWILSEDDCYGRVYPREAMLSEAVLLVCTTIRENVCMGRWLRRDDESIFMTEEELDKIITDCHARYKNAWSKEFREMDAGRCVKEIKRYMKRWMMFRNENGKIRILPIVGKVSGYYPADYKETKDE